MNIIKKLSHLLDKNETQVLDLLIDAPKKYKVYKIPKRSHGYRVIAQPSKELKAYQRAFLSLYEFPVHHSAMAYCKDKSIKNNALMHVNSSYLLKTDFENFFNSITPAVFWRCLEQSKVTVPEFSLQEKVFVEKLLFWCPSKTNNGKLVLSVGAPSSPLISNFCLFNFDQLIEGKCLEFGIKYTRYADDLTFSTNVKDVLYTVIPMIQNALSLSFGDDIRLNNSKTIFSSKAHNRHVTGITINNESQLSIGRKRKRYIKHLIHQFKYNKLDISDIAYLQGLLSFAKHIEPDFIERLKNKYTNELILRIYEIDCYEKK